MNWNCKKSASIFFDTAPANTTSPLLAGTVTANNSRAILNPANSDDVVGAVIEANADDVANALAGCSLCCRMAKQ